MYIKFQDLVLEDFTNRSIRRLITYANIAIMNSCHAIITCDDINKPLKEACEWFATSLTATYHADKIREILAQMEKDINQVLTDCENDKQFADTAAYTIGTNSETSENYSVV